MNAYAYDRFPPCCTGDAADDQSFIDPVCGMVVDGGNPALSLTHAGSRYHFCSAHCLKVFARSDKVMLPGDNLLHRKNRAVLAGGVGAVALIAVFLVVLGLANQTPGSVWMEVKRLWAWVLLLSGGFGLQLGLFVHIRHGVREKMSGATAEVAASGAVSTGSMIACCSHGLVNLLPMFGLSAAAAFLARYQMVFILFGVVSNLIGVTIMLGLARKNLIVFDNPVLHFVAGLNLEVVRLILVVTGAIAIGLSIVAA